MTKTHSGPGRPLLALVGLFGLMAILMTVQKATGTFLVRPAQHVLLTAFVTAALWLTLRYWRGIDEAARDAQKTAWLWGGALAMIPGMVLLMVLGAPHRGVSDRLLALAPQLNLLTIGGLIMALVQLAGFSLAWAVWWAGKR